jgi:hypothetical protein
MDKAPQAHCLQQLRDTVPVVMELVEAAPTLAGLVLVSEMVRYQPDKVGIAPLSPDLLIGFRLAVREKYADLAAR